MSEPSAREFLARLSVDDTYRAEVEKSVEGEDDTLAGVTRRAALDGYAFTAGELESAMSDAMSGELGDSELDQVAGGFNPQPTPPPKEALGDLMRNVLSGFSRLRY